MTSHFGPLVSLFVALMWMGCGGRVVDLGGLDARGDDAGSPCSPGAMQCTGSTPQTCDAEGHWVGSSACSGETPSCCGGVCVPGVVQVSTGGAHTCAVRTDGTLWCWGAKAQGQLGDASPTGKVCPSDICQPSPVQVTALGADVASVAAGDDDTCAIKTDGSLWCWGGEGSDSYAVPTLVSELADGVSMVSVGHHASTFRCAVDVGGHLWCWGNNDGGQLGLGTYGGDVTTPTEVTALGDTVAAIAAGGGPGACAIDRDGSLWCWGLQPIGNAPTSSQTCGQWDCETSPVKVEALGNEVAAVATSWSTCAVKKDGSLWCWGSNEQGQLGVGEFGITQPWPVEVTPLGSNVAQVAIPGRYACARKTDGTVWCWGNNDSGAVGDGTTQQRLSPVQVTALGNDVIAISASMTHTCAIKSDGTLWCWGGNQAGQLGNGTLTGQSCPMMVCEPAPVQVQLGCP